MFDRTHHAGKTPFYWLPGGGVEPGETAEEAVRRELIEEASLEISVERLLYVSENLFVESGDYRHEVILYFLARSGDPCRMRPSTVATTSGTCLPRPRGRSCHRMCRWRWRRTLPTASAARCSIWSPTSAPR